MKEAAKFVVMLIKIMLLLQIKSSKLAKALTSLP